MKEEINRICPHTAHNLDGKIDIQQINISQSLTLDKYQEMAVNPVWDGGSVI